MIPDDRECCANCRAFSKKAQECRRHAPTAVMVPTQSTLGKAGMSVLGLYPATREEDWCAEFLRKEDA